MTDREFDIILWGASGFTGQLVAHYLAETYGCNGELRWAIAGRNQGKLEQVRDEMGISAEVPLIVADASDPASVDAMVGSTSVVITTVGPYQLYGSDLVRACAEAGTDYVDLCGEPGWMHEMIAAHGDEPQPHIHIIVNRCHPTKGIAAKLPHSKRKLSAFARQWEQQEGKVYCVKRVENVSGPSSTLRIGANSARNVFSAMPPAALRRAWPPNRQVSALPTRRCSWPSPAGAAHRPDTRMDRSLGGDNSPAQSK